MISQAVMDVRDFNPKELQVKAVDNRVIVEGSYEKVTIYLSSKELKSSITAMKVKP